MAIIQKTVRFVAALFIAFAFNAQAGFITLETAIQKFTIFYSNHATWKKITDTLTHHAAQHDELLIDEKKAQDIFDSVINDHIDNDLMVSCGIKIDESNSTNFDSKSVSNLVKEQPVACTNTVIDTPTLASIIVPANRQTDGTSCGYHATFNAKAIQNIFYKQNAFTAENIQKEARSYQNLIEKNHQLEQGEIIEIAHTLDLKNLYFLHIDNDTVRPAGGYATNYSFEELITAIKQCNQSLCAHFICNTGGHWVVLSVIKDENKLPKLFFQDSLGLSYVRTDSIRYQFIQTIYNLVCNENIK